MKRSPQSDDVRRGNLKLESLEKRQLMAADIEMMFTGSDDASTPPIQMLHDGGADAGAAAGQTGPLLTVGSQVEAEPAPDLVAFARALGDVGVQFFGADWCPACATQKELFQDGADDLPYTHVANYDANRTLNATGQAFDIDTYPTWLFPDGRREERILTLQELSDFSGVAIPQSEQPTFEAIGNLTVGVGSPLHVPIDAYDPDGGPLTVTVSVQDPSVVDATVLAGNRSLRIDVAGFGDMVFELFEDRAPDVTGRIADLTESDFYDGILFHRVIDGFVLQAGDPTRTGRGGSTLGDIDDQFHPELQHNREGILSYAKAGDDTNDSQFFITEGPTRSLDYNHSVLGQLVEGFDIRESISREATSGNSGQLFNDTGEVQANRPLNDTFIEDAVIFTDTENSVVMLRAIGDPGQSSNVTFTVTDTDGNTFSETVVVSVAADNVDSQPYLNPIADPGQVIAGQPAGLQLSSIDVEGDPVTYFARSQSPTSAGTVSTNPTTGEVTVTPTAGFTGTFNVQVGVRRATPAPGAAANDEDTQLVSFEFIDGLVAAPDTPDLIASADTGASDTDNVTNSASLTFTIGGTVDGATVELINTATGTIVGTATATGTSTTITTNNIIAVGTYDIAARQTTGDGTSSNSSALSVTFDNVDPEPVTGSASTEANVDTPYQTDLVSAEEGSGLVYALTTAPTGATIDATTGVIDWTPTQSQAGANTFVVTTTDLAGNTREETFDVNAADEAVVELQLILTDLDGNVIDSVDVGQEFFLTFAAEDVRARSTDREGVFSAYADILFDPTLVRPVAGQTIEFLAPFTTLSKGTFGNGLIDELGAVSSILESTFTRDNPVARIRMEAIAGGTATIRTDPADLAVNEVTIYGNAQQIPAGGVAYTSTTLTIGQDFALNDDVVSVDEDSADNVIDVLSNDSNAGQGLTLVSVTQPTTGGTVTLSNEQISFTPTPDFVGQTTFTYRASDGGGIQDTATVTVNVTNVNDPPTAADDDFNVDQDSSANELDVLANDNTGGDPGQSLTILSVGSSTSGGIVTRNNDNTGLVYTPATGFVGVDTFTYTISDGVETTTGTVTVNVLSLDEPPTAVDDSFTVAEDINEAAYDVLVNDTRDVDNQDFTIDSLGAPSAGGSVRISADGTQFFYEPADNFNGVETVRYTIRDTGGGADSGTVTFTVTATNDPPPADTRAIQLVRGADDEVVLRIADLPDNVDDGETVTFVTVSSNTSAGGTASIAASGTEIRYTAPSSDFFGSDVITYAVRDSGGLTATGTINLDVANFTPRTIGVSGIANNYSVNAETLVLRGVDALGVTVDRAAENGDDGYLFSDVLPGDYEIEIPAIPFLQGGEEAKRIAVSSAAEDGDAVIDVGLGQLDPRFVSIRDWLGSTSRRSITVAVAPGENNVFARENGSGDTIGRPVVTLDADANQLTVRGVRETSAGGEEAVQATMPVNGDGRVELRGEVDGMMLFRIEVDASDQTFTPVTVTASASTPASDAGVATLRAAEVFTESNPPLAAEISTLSVATDVESEPAAEMLASVSRIDTLATSPAKRRSGEAYTAIGKDLSDEVHKSASTPRVAGYRQWARDAAMADLKSALSIRSITGDAIAQRIADDDRLAAEAIDAALSVHGDRDGS